MWESKFQELREINPSYFRNLNTYYQAQNDKHSKCTKYNYPHRDVTHPFQLRQYGVLARACLFDEEFSQSPVVQFLNTKYLSLFNFFSIPLLPLSPPNLLFWYVVFF